MRTPTVLTAHATVRLVRYAAVNHLRIPRRVWPRGRRRPHWASPFDVTLLRSILGVEPYTRVLFDRPFPPTGPGESLTVTYTVEFP